MSTLVVKEYDRDGVDTALVAATAAGDEFVNDGKTLLLIDNADVSPTTTTVVTQNTVDGEAVGDKAITIAASKLVLAGPFPTGIYNDVDGKVQMTHSSDTSLTVGAAKSA